MSDDKKTIVKLFSVAIMTLLIAGYTLPVLSADSYIQVDAEPGIQIFLDSEFKGVTNSEVRGLIISGVPSGSHRIRAVRQGFAAREESISVDAGKVFRWKIDKLTPEIKIKQEGDSAESSIKQKTGSLTIQSLPIESRVEIPSIGVSSSKVQDLWSAQDIPVGTYDVRVSAMGKSLQASITVQQGGNKRLLFNLMEGRIRDISAEEDAIRIKKEEEEAERRRLRNEQEAESARQAELSRLRAEDEANRQRSTYSGEKRIYEIGTRGFDAYSEFQIPEMSDWHIRRKVVIKYTHIKGKERDRFAWNPIKWDWDFQFDISVDGQLLDTKKYSYTNVLLGDQLDLVVGTYTLAGSTWDLKATKWFKKARPQDAYPDLYFKIELSRK